MKPLSFARWFVLTLVLCTLMGIAAPVRAADAVVGDGTPASCDQAAYNNAFATVDSSGSGTITFNCGAAPHTILLNSYNLVNGMVAIDGGGLITLDGTTSTSFFQVSVNAGLELRNITFQNGYFNGVSPLENFGILTLDNVALTNSANSGSALANYGVLVVHNSTFAQNTTDSTVTPSGGAIRNEGGTMQIRSSTFSGNQIMGGLGLGGAIANQSGTMTIESSSFELNHALDGGAIYVNGPATATITSSVFTTNTAGYGGAIEMGGSSGQIDLVRSTFRSNIASNDGGAIWTTGGDVDIDTVTFHANSSGTTGGAISCYGDNISVINSTLSNNYSNSFGGAIYSTCNVNITNITATENSANAGGGGLYQAGAGFATLQYATFADNTAPFGAGIYNDDSGGAAITIEKSLLTNNSTGNCDGTITSNGYNFSSDNNCGAFIQTGDQQGVSLPLEPLGTYGGPTHTRPPVAGNPVIDAIPTGNCGFAVDQRGIARPQNSNCDSGAVELGGTPYKLFMPTIKRG